ncbi:hypothetical protein RDI58_022675 [Solanum bulbocastanum]|uniref:Glutathione peroxidase n=1 Tax=Solanum bulbocastanum TaxID=147425 RepID=A0AAN8Y6C6_SOLBU
MERCLIHSNPPANYDTEASKYRFRQLQRSQPHVDVTSDKLQGRLKCKIEFELGATVRVNGPNEAPVYTFLKASKGGFLSKSIKWNFTKFLVDKEGQVIRRYGSTTPPLSIKADIQKALGEN